MPAPTRQSRRPHLFAVSTMILVLVALNLVWRAVRYGLGFPIWGDEAYVAVNYAERGFTGLAGALEYGQIVPVGFSWIEWCVAQTLGLSEYALRLVPWIAGLLSALLFVKLARRILDRRSALLAIAIFCASYYPVRHAAEIKPYSTDMLVSLVLLLLAWRCRIEPARQMNWLWLTIAGALSVWFSYPSVFIAGGIAAVLGWRALVPDDEAPPHSTLLHPLICGFTLAASFLAMYVTVGRKQAAAGDFLLESSHWDFTFPPLDAPWRLPQWFLLVHGGNMFAYPTGGNNGGSIGTFLLFVLGAAALWQRGCRTLVLLLLSPMPLMFVAAALQRYPYGGSARVAQHFAPAICLLAGAGVLVLFRWLFRESPRNIIHAARIFVMVMIAFIVGGVVRDCLEPFKKPADREDRRVVRLLANETTPDDRWIIYGSLLGETELVQSVAAWEGSGARFRFNVGRYAPVLAKWGPGPEEIAVDHLGDLWILIYHDNNAPFPQEKFDAWLNRVTDRLGPPAEYRRYPYHEDDEALDVYRFAGDK